MTKDELLYNQIYKRTKDFGRTQFVREIMRLERENKQLKEEKEKLIKHLENKIKISSTDDTYINGMHFNSQNHAIYKGILDILNKYKGDNNE